jgi:hypothetical protein
MGNLDPETNIHTRRASVNMEAEITVIASTKQGTPEIASNLPEARSERSMKQTLVSPQKEPAWPIPSPLTSQASKTVRQCISVV